MKSIAAPLILMCAVASHAADCVVEQEYLRFDDETVLKVELGPILKASDSRLKMSVYRVYAGEGRSGSAGSMKLNLYGSSEHGWKYLKFRRVVLLAGEERFRFDPDHDGTVEKGYVFEYMNVDLSDSQLRRIATAEKVEGVIGTDEFTLSREQREALREFIRYLDDPNLVVKPAPGPAAKAGDPDLREDANDGPARNFSKTAVLKLGISREDRNAYILPDVRLFDELDDILARGNEIAALDWQIERLRSNQAVGVALGTRVGILRERKRVRAAAIPVVLKVVVLEGRWKGKVGWCAKSQVAGITNVSAEDSKIAPEKRAATTSDQTKKAETKLKMALGLEKAKKPKAALDYYRELVNEFPGSTQAKTAAGRIKALEAK